MAPPSAVLDERFGVPGVVRFDTGPGGLVCAVVSAGAATGEIALSGAHVTRYAPRGEAPVLFLSARSRFAPGAPIRGGIPVIFPWFGPRADDPGAPQHGFARVAPFEVASVDVAGDAVVVVLELGALPGHRATWPHDFRLRCRVSVGPVLDVALEVQNPSTQPFTFEAALHTYLAVTDVTAITIAGLGGAAYIDKTDDMRRKRQEAALLSIEGEIDRLYVGAPGPCVVDDPAAGRRVTIEKRGAPTTVVWNPGAMKAATLADLGADQAARMVCVETAAAADDRIVLPAGATHELAARIAVARRG